MKSEAQTNLKVVPPWEALLWFTGHTVWTPHCEELQYLYKLLWGERPLIFRFQMQKGFFVTPWASVNNSFSDSTCSGVHQWAIWHSSFWSVTKLLGHHTSTARTKHFNRTCCNCQKLHSPALCLCLGHELCRPRVANLSLVSEIEWLCFWKSTDNAKIIRFNPRTQAQDSKPCFWRGKNTGEKMLSARKRAVPTTALLYCCFLKATVDEVRFWTARRGWSSI